MSQELHKSIPWKAIPNQESVVLSCVEKNESPVEP